MAGQQADSAAFHLASPGPGSSQYLCKGGKGMAGFIPRAILAFLWNPLSGATLFRKKKSVSFDGNLSELRPVYTSFTPGSVAARRELLPRVPSTAQFLAEQEVSPPPPSSDNGTRDLPTAARVFIQKNGVGFTLRGWFRVLLDFPKNDSGQFCRFHTALGAWGAAHPATIAG